LVVEIGTQFVPFGWRAGENRFGTVGDYRPDSAGGDDEGDAFTAARRGVRLKIPKPLVERRPDSLVSSPPMRADHAVNRLAVLGESDYKVELSCGVTGAIQETFNGVHPGLPFMPGRLGVTAEGRPHVTHEP
jgi:hypothetical protein